MAEYFEFTRTLEVDYHFVTGSPVYPEAVEQLCRYFSSLIDGVGAMSFAWKDAWIIVLIERTEECDHVNRPIYRIRGYQAPVDKARDIFINLELQEVTPEAVNLKLWEIPASLSTLCGLLQELKTRDQASSWGFGVQPADKDTSQIDFRHRLIPGRKEQSLIRWACRRITPKPLKALFS